MCYTMTIENINQDNKENGNGLSLEENNLKVVKLKHLDVSKWLI